MTQKSIQIIFYTKHTLRIKRSQKGSFWYFKFYFDVNVNDLTISTYRLDFTERQLEMMTFEMKDKICAIVEDVEYKVGAARLSF